MSLEIREATPADAASLDVIRRQALEAGLSGEYPRSAFADLVASRDERLRDWIEDDDALVLVAETEVTPVGFGAYRRTEARVLALHTAPDHQDEGCGTVLLERFERQARLDGMDRVVAAAPRNSVEFFDRRGFERRGTVEREGVTLVECRKPLS